MNLDFESARQYALDRLDQELPPTLFYHNIAHTTDDVVPAVERLAALEGIEGEALLLLITAAYYHDIGHIEESLGHELIGVRIASTILPDFGYTPAQIEVVSAIIMATRLPQSPQNRLGEILADADLDLFGRDDFLRRNQDLRAELAAFGDFSNDEEWYEGQLKFLQEHAYFTAAAQTLHNAKKQQNIQRLLELLTQYRA